jgi:hypothetical protein
VEALVADQTAPAELLVVLVVVLLLVVHLDLVIHPQLLRLKVPMAPVLLPLVKAAQVVVEVPLKQVRPVVLLQVEKAVTELLVL